VQELLVEMETQCQQSDPGIIIHKPEILIRQHARRSRARVFGGGNLIKHVIKPRRECIRRYIPLAARLHLGYRIEDCCFMAR
jgi:hypothetical protein